MESKIHSEETISPILSFPSSSLCLFASSSPLCTLSFPLLSSPSSHYLSSSYSSPPAASWPRVVLRMGLLAPRRPLLLSAALSETLPLARRSLSLEDDGSRWPRTEARTSRFPGSFPLFFSHELFLNYSPELPLFRFFSYLAVSRRPLSLLKLFLC